MIKKTIVVVDFHEVIHDVSKFKGLYDVYCRFTLTEMIETILSVSPYIDFSTDVCAVVGPWLNDDELDALDCDLFIIFFETLMWDIDKTVKDQYGHLIEDRSTNTIFVDWVDSTSALIRLE